MKRGILVLICAVVFSFSHTAATANTYTRNSIPIIEDVLDFLNDTKEYVYHYHNWWCWWYGCNYDDDDDGGTDVPLDGGLSFLAIAGAGLGIKKVIDKKSKNK